MLKYVVFDIFLYFSNQGKILQTRARLCRQQEELGAAVIGGINVHNWQYSWRQEETSDILLLIEKKGSENLILDWYSSLTDKTYFLIDLSVSLSLSPSLS